MLPTYEQHPTDAEAPRPRQITLLAIDGGGIRGIVPAQFLARLEKELNRAAIDTFDYFAGTSAGGLVALHFAVNGGSAKDAVQLFSPERAAQIMDKSLMDRVTPEFLLMKPKYDGRGKTQVLQEVFGERRLRDAIRPVLVTAFDLALSRIVVFKSTGGEDASADPYAWQVADATSAAPVMFPPVKIGVLPPRVLVDGGIAANNPAMACLAEALRMGYAAKDIRLISIGTGIPRPDPKKLQSLGSDARTWGAIDWLRHGIVDDLMQGASTGVDHWCKRILQDNYVRIQGYLDGVSPEMDNVDPVNLENLQKLGDSWYETMSGPVINLLRMASTPAPIPAPEQSDESRELSMA